jgi:hypothetical protein
MGPSGEHYPIASLIVGILGLSPLLLVGAIVHQGLLLLIPRRLGLVVQKLSSFALASIVIPGVLIAIWGEFPDGMTGPAFVIPLLAGIAVFSWVARMPSQVEAGEDRG